MSIEAQKMRGLQASRQGFRSASKGSGNAGLPGVRITLPPFADPADSNVSICAFRADGWLSTQNDAALVRVRSGPAQIMVTIYQAPNGGEAPKLQVLRLSEQTTPPAGFVPPPPPSLAPPRPGPIPALPLPPRQVTGQTASLPQITGQIAVRPMEIGAHVQVKGDIGAPLGEWVGDRGSARWVEGFAIAPTSLISLSDIEYQALLGRGWLSPWTEGGQFCGSRGMALPILGLRVRLRGSAAAHYDCLYAASFIDGTMVGPVANGQPCEATSLAPLEAFQVMLQPRVQGSRGEGQDGGTQQQSYPAATAPHTPTQSHHTQAQPQQQATHPPILHPVGGTQGPSAAPTPSRSPFNRN
jgi:hypothetical protein